jgi:hypothetical protein
MSFRHQLDATHNTLDNQTRDWEIVYPRQHLWTLFVLRHSPSRQYLFPGRIYQALVPERRWTHVLLSKCLLMRKRKKLEVEKYNYTIGLVTCQQRAPLSF